MLFWSCDIGQPRKIAESANDFDHGEVISMLLKLGPRGSNFVAAEAVRRIRDRTISKCLQLTPIHADLD